MCSSKKLESSAAPPPKLHAIALRTATDADAALIGSMHAMSWRHAYRGILRDAYLDAEVAQDRAVHWQLKLRAPREDGVERVVFIAEAGGAAIGFACAEWRADSALQVLLDNLHVLPPQQGRGVGKCLMLAVREWAQQHNAVQLNLYVIEDNRTAIAFYERQGWWHDGMDSHRLGGKDVPVRRYLYRL